MGALVGDLLSWYAKHARALPWRIDPRPYHVLLSELMLQQTRVDTVIPYYERFLARWPTLWDLAEADEADVLTEWAGLGYYSRARNLHRTAQAARDGLPANVDALRALPGIGPYTAGAIASIAFGRREPLVDGNVERVLARVYRIEADPASKEGKAALWARARELVDALPPGEGAGDLNQALMELGAMICAPRTPACGICPLSGICLGHLTSDPTRYPRKTPKAPPVAVRAAAVILRDGGCLLLARRAPGGLLGGMWEPPRIELAPGEDAREALERRIPAIAGVTPMEMVDRGELTHVFTHRRMACAVFTGRMEGSPVAGGPYDAIAMLGPEARGLSTLARKILALEGADATLPLPLAAAPAVRYTP